MIEALKSYITTKKLTPIRAIRAKCMDYTCNQIVEIREWTIKTCPLWGYRLGKRPTDKEIHEQAEAIKKA